MKKKIEETPKDNWVSDIKLHENGIEYKEIEFTEGIKIKLFNTNKPGRLEAETTMEYRIRRKLNNNQLKDFLKGQSVYQSANRIPYKKPIEQPN